MSWPCQDPGQDCLRTAIYQHIRMCSTEWLKTHCKEDCREQVVIAHLRQPGGDAPGLLAPALFGTYLG